MQEREKKLQYMTATLYTEKEAISNLASYISSHKRASLGTMVP